MRMATIKKQKQKITSGDKDVEKLEPLCLHCWWECKTVQLLWKTVWKFPQKLNIELSDDPAVPFLGIYQKELKTGTRRDICKPVFTAAWFTIAKRWKQPKCPLTEEGINKMWSIHTMEYYSALKRKFMLQHEWTLRILSEISQTQKDKYCIISLIWGP